MKFSIVHELGVPAEKFWEYQFTPEIEAAVVKATNLHEYRILESKEEGNLLLRRVHVIPDVVLPGVLKKLLGDSVGYTQSDRVPKGKLEYDWTVKADTLTEKIHIGGKFIVEPLGPNRCRRTIAGEVKVDIFGVGKIFEKFVIDELEKNYAKVAVAQERWVKAKIS